MKEIEKRVRSLDLLNRNYIEDVISDLQKWLNRQEITLVTKETPIAKGEIHKNSRQKKLEIGF